MSLVCPFVSSKQFSVTKDCFHHDVTWSGRVVVVITGHLISSVFSCCHYGADTGVLYRKWKILKIRTFFYTMSQLRPYLKPYNLVVAPRLNVKDGPNILLFLLS